MLDKKVMMPYIAISFAHQEKELNITLDAVQYSLNIYKQALEEGSDKFLKSKIIKPVFRKNN
jgi:glutamate-1-semialdehyde 2,1-aminomutase